MIVIRQVLGCTVRVVALCPGELWKMPTFLAGNPPRRSRMISCRATVRQREFMRSTWESGSNSHSLAMSLVSLTLTLKAFGAYRDQFKAT